MTLETAAEQAMTCIDGYLAGQGDACMAASSAALHTELDPPPAGLALAEPLDTGCVNLTLSVVDDASGIIYLQPPLTWINKWWPYYAEITGALGSTWNTIELPFSNSHNVMNGGFRWGVWSDDDGVTWKAWTNAPVFLSSPNRVRLSNAVPFAQDRILVALYAPYTDAILAAHMLVRKASPYVQPTVSGNADLIVGTTAPRDNGFGKLCPAANLYGLKVEDTSVPGPKNHALVIGGTHPGEWNALWACGRLIDFWRSDDPDAVYLRSCWVLTAYPDVNPQGRFGGLWRQFPDAIASDANRIWNGTQSGTLVTTRTAMLADTPTGVHVAADFHGYQMTQSPGSGQHIGDAFAPLTVTTRKHAEFKAAMIASGAPGWAWSSLSGGGYEGTFNRWAQVNRDAGLSLAVCVTPETGGKSTFLKADYEMHGEAFARALAKMTRDGCFPVTP